MPPATIAFDLGGTWFRSALVSSAGEISSFHRIPAISRRRHPEVPLGTLQEHLVDYLTGEARRLRAQTSSKSVGASIGAALDTRTNRIVGAAPLWGDTGRLDYDLGAALAETLPDLSWTVVNDVTAAAVGIAAQPEYAELQRIAAVTVSSGLAMRTIEPAEGRIPMSSHSGLQGELGHLAATFALGSTPRPRLCDCGARNHLAAFSSGRAIEQMLEEMSTEGCDWIDGRSPVESFSQALAARSQEARELLDAVTAPLAEKLLTVLAVDAEIERIVLTGGVVDGLGDLYMESLCDQMAQLGLYGSRLRSPVDFATMVRRAPREPSPTLRGAAYCAVRVEKTEEAAGHEI